MGKHRGYIDEWSPFISLMWKEKNIPALGNIHNHQLSLHEQSL